VAASKIRRRVSFAALAHIAMTAAGIPLKLVCA
jgi:hypothetical protein